VPSPRPDTACVSLVVHSDVEENQLSRRISTRSVGKSQVLSSTIGVEDNVRFLPSMWCIETILATFILAVLATLIGAYGTFTFLVPLLQEPQPAMIQVRACKAFVTYAVVVGFVLSHAPFSAYASTQAAPPCGSAAVLHDSWVVATPESFGFESRQLCAIGNAVRHGRLRNLHGVVVARRGRLVFEQYFTGRDERGGSPVGDVTFGPETLHDVRSITKSIVSLLYGIALAQGQVGSVDRSLLDAFPEFADLRTEPARMGILVKHALTMTMGTEWNEDLPYSDPRNGERQMEAAADRYRFVLDRPLVAAPGERWNYNGGATAVIAKLVSRGTGRPLLDFAQDHLFAPLGITDVEWVTDRKGEPKAAAGLRLRPRDLAKIGQLVLQRGRWGEQEVIPGSWLQEATTAQAQPDQFRRYGYQWWLGGSPFGDAQTPWVAGFGLGGQRLFIVPELELVVVVTAGNYDKPGQGRLPIAILDQFVLPALVGAPRE
jgi:CubicO group peptidase (beta-lactamase class C family)